MLGSNENDYFRTHNGKNKMPCIIFLMPEEEVKMPCHAFRSKLSASGPRSGVRGLKQVPGFMSLETGRRRERERSVFFSLWRRQREEALHSFLIAGWMRVKEIRPVHRSLANRNHSVCAFFSLSSLSCGNTHSGYSPGKTQR